MAEYSKEKLYFLQLKEDFFKSHKIRIVEGMPDGKEYVLFLLKLMCEATSYNGYLRFDKNIPYTEEMLSAITDTNVEIVKSAMKLFQELGMMEITKDKTIFIPQVPIMTNARTAGAIAKEDKRRTKGGHLSAIDKSIETRDNIYINNGFPEENLNKTKKVVNKESEEQIDWIKLALDITEMDNSQLPPEWFDGKNVSYEDYLKALREKEE